MKNNRLCVGLALSLCLAAVPVGIRSGANSGMSLHEAALKGDDVTVERLLAAGEVVNAVGVGAQTPLHLAAAGGHEVVIRQLLHADADIDALGGLTEYTPLHRAAENGRDAAVLLLLTAGARADVPGSIGGTPLNFAASQGHDIVVRCLLAAGADVNAADISRCIPLYGAAESGHEAVARLLAACGAIPLTQPQREKIISDRLSSFSSECQQQKRTRLEQLQVMTEQASLERQQAIESTLDKVKIDSERLPRDLQKIIIAMSEHPDVTKWWRKVDLDRLRAVSNMRLPIKALERIVMFDSSRDIGLFRGMLE